MEILKLLINFVSLNIVLDGSFLVVSLPIENLFAKHSDIDEIKPFCGKRFTEITDSFCADYHMPSRRKRHASDCCNKQICSIRIIVESFCKRVKPEFDTFVKEMPVRRKLTTSSKSLKTNAMHSKVALSNNTAKVPKISETPSNADKEEVLKSERSENCRQSLEKCRNVRKFLRNNAHALRDFISSSLRMQQGHKSFLKSFLQFIRRKRESCKRKSCKRHLPRGRKQSSATIGSDSVPNSAPIHYQAKNALWPI